MANIPVEPRRRSTGPLLIALVVGLLVVLAVWYVTREDDAAVATTPAETAPDRSSDPVDDAIDAAGSAADAAGEAVEDAADAVGEAVEDVTDGQ